MTKEAKPTPPSQASEEKELHRTRLGTVGASVFVQEAGGYAVALTYAGDRLCLLENEETEMLRDILDECVDLIQVLHAGETVTMWKARTGQDAWLFSPGRVVMTPGAAEALTRAGIGPDMLLGRHLRGDWGNLCKEDREENELSLQEGFRIFSVYPLPESEDILWIITEADRSATTLLCPHEY